MKAKHLRVVLPMLTAVLILGGCGAGNSTQKDILEMLNTSDTITIELTEEYDEVAGYKYTVEWIQLGDMTSSREVRDTMDDLFNITGNTGNKNGVFYVNEKGENTQNNTLAVAMKNRAFNNIFNDSEDLELKNMELVNCYTDVDVDEEKTIYAAISDYFELLKAGENGESNISDSLSRAEAMSLVFKAMNPVDANITENKQFSSLVGENDLNVFAAQEEVNAFINTADDSLNAVTYTQSMTKAEFVYMVMNSVFGNSAVQNVDSSIELVGLTNAGNLAEELNIEGKMQVHSVIIKSFVNNPTSIDESIYKAIVLAKDKEIINNIDDLDNAITKADAVEILCKALMQNANIEEFNYQRGEINTGFICVLPDATEDMSGNGAGDVYVPTKEDLEVIDEATLAIQEAEEADEQLESEPEENVADYTVVSIDAKTMYAQQSVNLRQGPSTEYDKVGSLSKNRSVTVTGKVTMDSGAWYQLSTGEFVSAKYLGADKVETQEPTDTDNGGGQSSEGEDVSGATGDGSGSSRGNRGNKGAESGTIEGGNLH